MKSPFNCLLNIELASVYDASSNLLAQQIQRGTDHISVCRQQDHDLAGVDGSLKLGNVRIGQTGKDMRSINKIIEI
jgi:hypothetical protein